MSEMSDYDRRKAHEWARMAANNDADPADAPWKIVARVFLDATPAPPKSLADEIRGWDTAPRPRGALAKLADRVEAVEKKNADLQDGLAAEGRRVEKFAAERDAARSELDQWKNRSDDWQRMAQENRRETRRLRSQVKRQQDLLKAYSVPRDTVIQDPEVVTDGDAGGTPA